MSTQPLKYSTVITGESTFCIHFPGISGMDIAIVFSQFSQLLHSKCSRGKKKKKCTAGENNLTLISNIRKKSGSSNTELNLRQRIKGHELATRSGSTKADVGAR